MPRLKPETQEAHREHILDTAERCFAQSGFHRCTTGDICEAAGISAGKLYNYFKSKEDLIAGIVARDRDRLTAQFAELSESPDLAAAIARLGEHYAVEEPQYKRILNLEIAAEATRNPRIAEIFLACDRFVRDSLTEVIARAMAEDRIRPAHPADRTTEMICIIGEGLFMRRAVDTAFDAATIMPAVMDAVVALLNPAEPRLFAAADPAEETVV